MRSVPEVNKDFAALQVKVKGLESEHGDILKALAVANEIIETVSLPALTSNDAKAKAKLEQANTDNGKCEVALKNIDAALRGAARESTELQAELKQAEAHALRQRRKAIGEKLKDQARFLNASAMSHAQLLTEHAATLREFIGVTGNLGEPTGNLGLKHFRRFWEAALHKIAPFEYGKQPEIYSSGDYETFLTEQIDGIGNRSEQQSQQAKQTA